MADVAPPVDNDLTDQKKSIWQRWGSHMDWADMLQKKAAYKAMDIPQDDMNVINASKTTTGAGGGAIAATALAGGIPATVLAAMLGLSAMRGAPTPAALPVAPAATAPAGGEAKWDAGLYKLNADGTYTLVDLPMLPADAKVK